MNTFKIKKVNNSVSIKAFHQLPFEIYKNDENFIGWYGFLLPRKTVLPDTGYEEELGRSGGLLSGLGWSDCTD